MSRRQALQTLAGIGLVAPSLGRLGPRAGNDPDAGTGFSLGVASGDPTPSRVVLWTRVDDNATSSVRWFLAADPRGQRVVLRGTAGVGGDGTVIVDVGGVPEPGRHWWYWFEDPTGRRSAIGRTRTLPEDPHAVRLAVTSCQDWQQGWYSVWRDVAAQDLDAVLFLGDYIYEYATYTEPWRVRRHTDEAGRPVGETRSLEDYRARYRLYRSDPDLRLAHRRHPFITVWDDHEVAGDRWLGGAVNHGDDPGESEESFEAREEAGVQAFLEYLPVRVPPRVAGRTSLHRSVSFGSLAELFVLDSRTYRSEGVGGTNRNFNPLANLDEPGISDPSRTILGPAQRRWLLDGVSRSKARWKLVGSQLMVAPLNLVGLPELVGGPLAHLTQLPVLDDAPLTYHRDGIPVNTDQWDGYQPERRAILEHLREHEVRDVVFLSGDIHLGWSMEVHVEQGDAPIREPVAVEFVCPGISSENLNERIGIIATGRPLPDGATRPAGPAAITLNRHVRYVDFDANGYVLLDVRPDRVVGQHRVLRTLPWRGYANPVEDPLGITVPAPLGTWAVERGRSRLLPA